MTTSTQSRDTALPSLVRSGFTPTTDLVFRTLRVHGPRSVAALARELGMPAKEVCECLDALQAAGLATQSPTGSVASRIWSAADPARTAAALLARSQAQRGKPGPARRAEGLVFGQPLYLGPGILHLQSREAARNRMAGLVDAVRHEQLTFNPEVRFDEASMRAGAGADRKLADRGVTKRVIGVQARDSGLLVPYGGEPASAMAYREAEEVPMKLIVLDRRVAFFPVDPGDYERGYLEISQAPVVEGLVRMFEQHWDAAQPPSSSGFPPRLLPREAALLALLARGLTDARAAHRLAISPRSVSSTVRGLMDRFGVQNRFQLGVVLGARGIVDLPSTRANDDGRPQQ